MKKESREKKKIRRAEQKKTIEEKLKGSGIYIYENNTNADFALPRPTEKGLKIVGPNQRFEGDSYYLTFVKPPFNFLKLIDVKNDSNENFNKNESFPPIAQEGVKSECIIQETSNIEQKSESEGEEKNRVKRKYTRRKNKRRTINNKKGKKMKEHLILDQPDIIKEDGKAEPVVEDQKVEEKEVLLTEDPSGDMEIINESSN